VVRRVFEYRERKLKKYYGKRAASSADCRALQKEFSYKSLCTNHILVGNNNDCYLMSSFGHWSCGAMTLLGHHGTFILEKIWR